VVAERFDALVKQVLTTRVTRWTALRAVVAGAGGALVGARLPAGEVTAARRSNKKTVCICKRDTVHSCSQTRVLKRRLRKVLKKFPCSYRGECHGFNPCSPLPTSGESA
jgi:hypothetical protein